LKIERGTIVTGRADRGFEKECVCGREKFGWKVRDMMVSMMLIRELKMRGEDLFGGWGARPGFLRAKGKEI
jgi:hypothetical protein